MRFGDTGTLCLVSKLKKHCACKKRSGLLLSAALGYEMDGGTTPGESMA